MNLSLKLVTAIMSGIITLGMSGCYVDFNDDGFCERGRGSIRTTTRDLPSFTGISNSMNADIYIRKGNNFEVSVQSNHNIVNDILTDVSGEQLYIETRKCLKDHNTTITVTTPSLRSIANFGSGSIHSADIWVTNNMKLSISGSGEVEMPVDCDDLDVTLTGSGRFELSGYTEHLRSVISGSGNVNAFALHTSTCNVTISGSGDSFLHVDETLTGTISGSGNVYYRGFPAIDVAVSGSGRVINRN
ncbi:DUF2807 domain-containing protein [Fulvivirga ulvae]|uniref:head GIN domain-containing protein n=1 Tax=Fulvivirga ulvae TaxID=2904245 RepID=UPI001F40D879|nr:head GIN domain-containing protein [Fulvivirga ulvae]UII32454.1 DUF2807 domain-containing protein [Fulvivirga ulvae]